LVSTADLLFTGASVETMTDGARPADAVAVRGGRIVLVGSSAEVQELVGPQTRVVELRGETLLPGFQDAHIHPIDGGMLANTCDLHDLAGAPAYLEAIAAHAAAHPERAWITGEGWSLTAFPRGEPERGPLDAIVPDRPALLFSDDGHVGWANSRALEIGGIDRSTPDPPDGRIVRDVSGAPTGTLVDGAADILGRHLATPSHAEIVEGLRLAQRQLHALGITAWQDANVRPPALAAYREAAEAGWLSAHVVAALWWELDGGLEQIDAFEQQRAETAIGRLRAGSVKLMLDGILESRTAFMTSPYIGQDGSESADAGGPFIDPTLLREAVVELDRRGFQAHFHAIGDGAVRLALDVVEAARAANGPSDHRHHISHIEVINPDDVPRFARLGVVANMQPFWAADDEQMRTLRIPALGPDRAGWQYPFASLLRSGAVLAGGSDWTVTTANPLLEIEVAVNRVLPDTRDAAPFLPDERLSLDSALRAFTIGSAFVNHLDAETGTIEVGKLADLVVLDRDLRAPDAGPIGDASVRMTFVDGEEVFSADGQDLAFAP
jgi:predicted amidohydrolase YtcJ